MSTAKAYSSTLSQPDATNPIFQDCPRVALPEVAARLPATDLAEVIRETLSSLQGSFPPNLRVHLDFAGGSSLVRLEMEELARVVRILLCNTLDAMSKKRGLLLIEVFTISMNDQHPKVYLGEAKPGRYSVLALSHTGKALDATELSCSSEGPESRMESSQAPGFGLSALSDILKRSGGHIWVYNQPGMGTQFELFLPVV